MSTQTEFESKTLEEKINTGCQTEKHLVNEVVQTALQIPPATDIYEFFPLLPGHRDYQRLMKKKASLSHNSSHASNVIESKVVPVASIHASHTPKEIKEKITQSGEKIEDKKIDWNDGNGTDVPVANDAQRLKLHHHPTQSAAKVHSIDPISELFSKMWRFSEFYR